MDSFLEEDEVEGVAGVKGVFGVRGEEGISGELVPFDETRSASILLLSLASFDSSIEPSTLLFRLLCCQSRLPVEREECWTFFVGMKLLQSQHEP